MRRGSHLHTSVYSPSHPILKAFIKMEDRHYLSEPRPIEDLGLPTWEVDIFREGVGTPIMTITLDSNSLPPRKRKKKVVWKLPDSFDQVPKFGMEDRKRIFDICKQQKKELKKQRKSKESYSSDSPDADPPRAILQKQNSTASTSNDNSPKLPPIGSPPPGFDVARISLCDDVEKKEKLKPPLTKPPEGTNGSARTTIPNEKKETDPPRAPPESIQPPHKDVRQHQPAPPGLAPEPPGIVPQQPPPIMNLRQFIVPPTSTLAQVVTETYYLLLRQGLIHELIAHYAPTAQKSLTVGCAHAVCQKPEDRLLQLQSLVGMVVQIKGVLQQPTAGNGTLVLITGTCVHPHALPFCHSLVMVPIGGGFQIQNDALCFLTTEDAPAV
jgi:hypothetical protein